MVELRQILFLDAEPPRSALMSNNYLSEHEQLVAIWLLIRMV